MLAVNPGVVQTARASGISVRISEDLANIINDDAPLPVLPVVGKRFRQNLTDLKLLRGIDRAILQVDVPRLRTAAEPLFPVGSAI